MIYGETGVERGLNPPYPPNLGSGKVLYALYLNANVNKTDDNILKSSFKAAERED